MHLQYYIARLLVPSQYLVATLELIVEMNGPFKELY